MAAPPRVLTRADLDPFTLAYIVAALWVTTDNSTPQGGEPLDQNYDIEDIDQGTLFRMAEDCRKFQEEHGNDLIVENCCYKQCPVLEYAGHDFWLTRAGHGCGFWDGDWEKEVGARLTEACGKLGEFYLYVGDDDKIHGS